MIPCLAFKNDFLFLFICHCIAYKIFLELELQAVVNHPELGAKN